MVGTKREIQIGDRDGGGVYVGKSATTGEDLHAALTDEPEYLTYNQAMARQPGREHVRLPTPQELADNLYDNRNTGALKGTFNTSGSMHDGLYRSDTPKGYGIAVSVGFDDETGGNKHECSQYDPLPVRFVW